MSVSSSFGPSAESVPLEVLWEDGERIYCKTWRDGDGARQEFMAVLPADEHPSPDSINRLTHEYGLRDHLDDAWALQPLELAQVRGRPMLVLKYHETKPLDHLIGPAMEIGRFLPLAVALLAAVGRVHERGLIHKDLKPNNILVNSSTGQVLLTGFGIASRLPRERQLPNSVEFIAGTLAYMAPEQTGRMNRSIDSRSDLYSLGVTLYEMLTGSPPFKASDSMEWVHCHIARQPISPSERLTNVPASVSAIIMKLLAKTAEERYQTAAGAESDLRRCLSEWETQGRIKEFAPGEHDQPDRLMIPEKLYGRDREIEILLSAFDRIVAGGSPELVLVSGYSGIGKSAVVNELHKPLVPPRGLFASGKFDQYKRDIPYATLAQAFQSLLRPLLSKSEEELHKWRNALREALDPNGQLIADLVPELQHIIGEQPPVPELPLQDAQGRFQLVFRRFISVFARPEHPLALFLDDLQWLDAATLDLLEDLLTRGDLQHLLLIGAYRDNEVSSTHPLARKLDAMRQAGATLRDIILTPLGCQDLGHLLTDSLHCEPERAVPLAQLIHDKTTGNPFFAIQFISALADEALLTFDYGEARWSWELNRIRAKGFTDNVVDLMVGKLSRLPLETQKALQQFACMGNSAEFEMLRLVYQDSNDEMHEHLWEAVRTGLIFRSESSYRFLHDRVQEAAYSLIPTELRAEAHLKIGTLLAAYTPPADLKEAIFEIVNQLNRGAHLITSIEERERAADLNLIAGRRAKISTAYESALKYLRAAGALLAETTWEHNYELIFSIEYLMAECELLTAEMGAAEDRLSTLARRCKNNHDFALVTRLRLTLYTTLDQSDLGVDVLLEFLRRGGTVWSQHPTRDDVLREYNRIWSLLGSRQIEELVDLPLMTNPDILDTLDVLTEIVTPALFYDENLSSLVVCRMVSLSLEYGNCDGSCFGYEWFAMFAGPRFNNYKEGYRFGQLGYDLVEKRGLTRYQARTYINYGNGVMPWAIHAASGRAILRRAFDIAYQAGDLTFAAYWGEQLVTNCLIVGDPLAEVQTEAENGLEFAKNARFGLVVDICGAQLGLVRTLRGLTPKFGCFDAADYNELQAEQHYASNPVLSCAEFFYWTRKLQGRFFAGDLVSAVDASIKAQQLLWTATAQLETADCRFFGALARAAAWDSASPDQKKWHFDALTDHSRQLEVWAEHCPANFESRVTLAQAEIARIEVRAVEAEQLYEDAIRSARTNGFVHVEALAHELAANFYGARGFATTADAYLRNARACYAQWGAQGKVNQLDSSHPHLQTPSTSAARGATVFTPVAQLDAETVIKASQSLSSEIDLRRLIEKLMHLVVENAGAGRGLLILIYSDGPRIEAEATTAGGTIDVAVRQMRATPSELPQSVLQYVLRTRERLVFDDVSAGTSHSEDPYVRERRPKSVLCMPILTNTRVIGALYLENTLAAHCFTSGRVAILEILATQAAISMENARLYSEQRWNEALLSEAQHLSSTGSFLWRVTTNEITWSAETYRIFEVDPAAPVTLELVGSRCHPEDLPVLNEMIGLGRGPGSDLDHELRLLMPDSSIKHLHLVAHASRTKEGQLEYIGAVQDITARRLSEEALAKARSELAHVTRVTGLGVLTASIAHEVNQPLTAIASNGETSLHWLARDEPDIEKVRMLTKRVVADARRASEIIGRIRDMASQRAPEQKLVSIDDIINESLTFLRHELQEKGTVVSLDLTRELPQIVGDRIQLQQVIVNLTVNALQAMTQLTPTKRSISVRTMLSAPQTVCCSIEDSGPGIDPKHLPRLFDSFFTTKDTGMGMGLAICQSILEAHGGRIRADNNSALGGARFSFDLLTHHAR
jgi:predicted ATPase/signal transduction histidine kinase